MARKTIGAISGHFLSTDERKQMDALAEKSIGAAMERAEVASHPVAPATYRGICHACKSVLYADPCPRCAMYAADPRWYLDDEGEWCAR